MGPLHSDKKSAPASTEIVSTMAVFAVLFQNFFILNIILSILTLDIPF